jgi:flagellar protein FliO/FliZ
MAQSLVTIGLFLALLVSLPVLLKWLKQRANNGLRDVSGHVRFISAVAVGPHQRVVTVEVGPEGARTWLTLGVTANTITCLHTTAIASADSMAATPVADVPVLQDRKD